MKTNFLFVAFLLAAIVLPNWNYAQIAGQNPALFTHRNNGWEAGIGKLPVVEGDITGRMELRGWVSNGFYYPGIQIQSVVTGPVLNDGFPAEMQFSTGYPLTQRMVIADNGRVGIGIDVPVFDLDIVGNTHTSGDFYGRIHFDDNQGTDDAPNTYIDEAYFELKQRAILNAPAGLGDLGGLLTLAPGGTSYDHQLFFADDGMFTRRWDGGAASWAGSTWYKMLTSEDINGTTNQVAKFTGPSSLGDSQIFDDGSQVAVGTSTPTAGYLFDVAGSSRIGGNVLTTGDQTIEGSAHIDNLVTIGTANTPAALGPINTSGYRLFVEGGVLTDEVLVRTGWADYVFEADYLRPTLAEVKQHITENGHLPNTPSAEEVEANGLALAEATVNQQEKIEELFLYLIELNEEVQALKSENAALQAKLQELEQK